MFKKLFSKSLPLKEPVSPGEKFSIFKLNLDEGWGLATINKAYDHYPNKAFFPWYAIINIGLQYQNENGHPANNEADVLIEMEESVNDFLKKGRTVHFIGRVTRRGERDLLYYLDNRKFDQKEAKTLFDSLNAIRPLHFEIHKDPKWSLVKSFIS